MANKIQIKRSTTNAAPVGLANGELAYTSNGEILFLGHPDGVTGTIAIGGKRFPGTLTANQALVANATSGIDKVIVANLVPTSIFANGSAGVDGAVLHSNGSAVYWLTPSEGVAYDLLAVANTQANQGIIRLDPSSGANDDVLIVGANGVTVSSNSTAILITGTAGDIEEVIAGSGLTGGGTSGQVTLNVGQGAGLDVTADAVAVIANNGLVANSTGVFVNANNGIVANSSGVFVTGGAGLVSNSSGVHVGQGNGIVVDADSIRVQQANGIIVDAGGVTISAGPTLTVNNSGLHVNSTLQLTDLTISGNLDINGTLTTVDTTNLSVTDSIISLARGQTTANTLDIGFYGTYGNATATSYSGLFRDATDGVYRLFAGQIPEPTTTVDTANVNFAYATLQSYLTTGALVANSSAVNITANSTVSVALTANTLSLSTALPATSGGTGLNSYTSGDLLVANTGNTLSKLSLGTDGKVLQSNGTAVIYADLDGGTF